MIRFTRTTPPRYDAMPDIRLTGARIILRPPQRFDCAPWMAVRAQNRAMLEMFEPLWPDDALTPVFFERRLARQNRDWAQDRAYSFLINPADDARAIIGGININNVHRGAAQYASLGYWLGEDRQGQGLMGEALGIICRYAFEDLRLHRLNAATLPENIKSRRLLERAGFAEEGFAKSYIEINGAWRDHVLFGLVRSD